MLVHGVDDKLVTSACLQSINGDGVHHFVIDNLGAIGTVKDTYSD